MKQSTDDAWSDTQTTSTSGISPDVGQVVVTSPSVADTPKGKCLHIHLILQLVIFSLTLLMFK